MSQITEAEIDKAIATMTENQRNNTLMLAGMLLVSTSTASREIKIDALKALISQFRVAIVMEVAEAVALEGKNPIDPIKTSLKLSHMYLRAVEREPAARQRTQMLLDLIMETKSGTSVPSETQPV